MWRIDGIALRASPGPGSGITTEVVVPQASWGVASVATGSMGDPCAIQVVRGSGSRREPDQEALPRHGLVSAR
jgi:hypothetical protein